MTHYRHYRYGTGQEDSAAYAEKAGKPPVTRGMLMLFPRAVKALAVLSQVGAAKHGQGLNMYRGEDAIDLYTDAIGRHLVDEAIDGPVNAGDSPDGGAMVLHAEQVAWCAMARLELVLTKRARVAYLLEQEATHGGA